MAFPAEFNYNDEEQFIQLFLIPLLQRLGFSLVVNYHGNAEFGKDLIFAEIDRFGHVRYHGLQAKYLPSISLNGVEELITDCKQSFANAFRHPQTGSVEKISSFYAVNGGSLGPEATQHYFNSLLPSYGGNARLLQGKDLVSLDRWASSARTETITAIINGILIELKYNDNIVLPSLRNAAQSYSQGGSQWTLNRLRTDALSAYLRQPVLQANIEPAHVLKYCTLADISNRQIEFIAQGFASTDERKRAALQLLEHLERLAAESGLIASALETVLQTIGPLAAV